MENKKWNFGNFLFRICFHIKDTFFPWINFFLSFSRQDTHVVTQKSVQKSGLKFKLLYLRNYSFDYAEIWCIPKENTSLSSKSFSLKPTYGLGYYGDFNFLNNVCNHSSCRKFQGI